MSWKPNLNYQLKVYPSLFILILSFISSGLFFPQSAKGEDVGTLVKKVAPSVVRVEAVNATRKIATGVVIEDDLVLTTALISPGEEKIFIINTKGERKKGKLVGFDPISNLALIKAKLDLPAIKIGQAKKLAPGDWIGVVCLSPENAPAVTQGIVSSVAEDRVRLNVWVLPGSSGSPVIDNKGKMVGVLRGIYFDEQPVVFEVKEKELAGSGLVVSRAQTPSSGMAMAVPVEVVLQVVREIKEKGGVSRGWLGVLIVENKNGEVEIFEVEKDSPAELAGLEEGDIILEVEGKKVSSTQQLSTIIQKRKPGEIIKVRIRHRGQEKKLDVRLGEYPKQDFWRESERKLRTWFPDYFRSFPPSRWPWQWSSRRYIGLYLQELNRELSAHFGVKEGRGLLVSRVEKDSPAEEAGLEVGDVIVRAEGRRVETIEELSQIIQNKEKGDIVELEFLRDKKNKKVEVEVAEERGSFDSWFNLNVNPRFRERIIRWGDQARRVSQEELANWRKKIEEINRRAENNFVELTKKLRELTKEGWGNPSLVQMWKFRGLKV